MSWGQWSEEKNKEHAADLIETHDGYKYYFIVDSPFAEEKYFSF